MTVEEACILLDEQLGCGSDTVFWRGEETTPGDLRYCEAGDEPAKGFHITYLTIRKGKIHRVHGTLHGMVKERRIGHRYRAPRRKKNCPVCGGKR